MQWVSSTSGFYKAGAWGGNFKFKQAEQKFFASAETNVWSQIFDLLAEFRKRNSRIQMFVRGLKM